MHDTCHTVATLILDRREQANEDSADVPGSQTAELVPADAGHIPGIESKPLRPEGNRVTCTIGKINNTENWGV
ncbi:hypothetical protein EF834_00900 [Rhodococcus spongiicola]|uniref:Uncharacterized protein n=1 Tax=Rhodococcus spongiicola TaxID=2487352 RepID=A0A438B4Y7_9NOCA|nr:hypothetical protein EF834_00900 [Rhodococcus spongiicola]